MNSRLLLILCGLCFSLSAYSQNKLPSNNPWQIKNKEQTTEYQQVNGHSNNHVNSILLDSKQLNSILNSAQKASNKHKSTLLLPLPNGTFHEFEFHENAVMHPALAAKFPGIRTYVGRSLENTNLQVRADLSPRGFHVMILGDKNGTSFIEPKPESGRDIYRSFYKKESGKSNGWACHADEVNEIKKDILAQPNAFRNPDCKLRTYRIALACTGEFAQYHGGSEDGVLAAMASTLNRVNGIFERDLGVRLEMIENNDELIFLLPNADPFSNSNGSAMLDENQVLCDEVIGSENYDIGHVFSTGGGGIAIVGSVCDDFSKAGGVTGNPHPEGDGFDIDYVAHELGHQFGANHTQNNPCNRNGATSVEPGSGSTVMSYAGVCSPNVQLFSDAYFHAISIGEINNHLSGSGNSCAAISMENNCPEANAGADYFIPRSTPFVLSGNATDADAEDELTYCWEQMDNQPAVMPPAAGNAAGPAFRSRVPSILKERFFPKMETLTQGLQPVWEILPSQSRTMNFMLTVRDNHLGGGCTSQDDIKVTVDASAGPFEVERPLENTTWVSGTEQLIIWDVANTDQAPINCATVDILLSLDGGQTWPITLADGISNDGEHKINVPNYPTAEARVMVKSNGNIFFDISNGDLQIIESEAFTVSIASTNVKCFGEKNGAISTTVSGGEGNYKFAWSNGKETAELVNLAAGTYNVTVTSGSLQTSKSIVISQPELLTLEITGTDATQGSNGTVTAVVNGGSGNYDFFWENGSTQATLKHVPAGHYAVTVSDGNNCTVEDFIELKGTPPLPIEYGTLENVGESWQIIELKNTYDRMVVVASIEIPGKGFASVVTRIREAEGNRFEVKLQQAGESDYPFHSAKIHYLVAEEGAYSKSKYGVNFEAWRVASNKTSTDDNWQFTEKEYSNEYNSPVVLGQVMGYRDHKWSAFWSSRNGKRDQAPTATSFSIGKHAGQDNRNTTGAIDEIGYFVFETGSGYINGKRFLTAVGKDKVKGLADAQHGYTYALDGFSETEMAIVSSAGMDDSEGAWPVLSDNTPTASLLSLFSMEDQSHDSERSHSSEQVAYFVFGKESPELADNEELGTTFSERPDPEAYIFAYPNPSQGAVNLEFFQNEPGGPTIIISDFFGRVKDEFTLIHAEPGLRSTNLELGNLPTGTYVLQILEGDSRRTIKIIII